MTNNTTMNETSNDSGMVEALSSMLTDNIEVFLVLGILCSAISLYGWCYVPQFRFLVTKLIGRYDSEIMALYDEHLTPKMRDALDDASSKYVKNEILKQVILESFDHTEKKAKGTVRKIIRDAAKGAK
jgi:hypothetical protein|tara:strand:+ start:287 stop:670 length:384 start_codon:yes stop_codon:yes gene_type:complete